MTPEPLLLVTRLILIEDCERKREEKGREGKEAGEGEGEREHLWTRESGVVYREIKIKAVTVNEVSEESEIKCMEERETHSNRGRDGELITGWCLDPWEYLPMESCFLDPQKLTSPCDEHKNFISTRDVIYNALC